MLPVITNVCDRQMVMYSFLLLLKKQMNNSIYGLALSSQQSFPCANFESGLGPSILQPASSPSKSLNSNYVEITMGLSMDFSRKQSGHQVIALFYWVDVWFVIITLPSSTTSRLLHSIGFRLTIIGF